MVAYQGASELSKKEKLICLQETVKLNREGLIPFWNFSKDGENGLAANIVLRAIDRIKNMHIDHKDKENKILHTLGQKLKDQVNPFSKTAFGIGDRYSIGIFDENEFGEWMRHLCISGFVTFTPETLAFMNDPVVKDVFTTQVNQSPVIGLTINGWEKINRNSVIETKVVFIAMAFTDNNRVVISSDIRDAIKTCLEGLGFEPVIVDEVEYNEGIMDKIIASINESKFVIAELTHQKSGVYYEAGYAKGKGLPVIHIVHKSELEMCHFDVKHLNLIVWNNIQELTKRLEARIKASIP